tara:strand:+ start:2455 stop:2625 length:171 start_codon:yes stop_codon:yes gene_type:complete
MNDDSSKITRIINGFSDYLHKLKQEEDHSLAVIYDYDIEPLPDDIIDEANKIEREK